MIGALALSALTLMTVNGRVFDGRMIPGNYDYAQASISVDPATANPGLQSEWLGSESGGDLIQIGWWWWGGGHEALPFFQLWVNGQELVNPIINYPLPVGSNENVSLVNKPGTEHWTAYLLEGSTWVSIWAGDAGTSAKYWEVSSESQIGVIPPIPCAGVGLGRGAYVPRTWVF